MPTIEHAAALARMDEMRRVAARARLVSVEKAGRERPHRRLALPALRSFVRVRPAATQE